MVVPNRPSRISVDFSGVEVNKGGRADHIPEGDYLSEVVDCIQRTKKDDPSVKMLNWHLKIVEPAQFRGKSVYNNTVLVPESLWALRSFLVNMLGEDKVPQRSLEIPIEKIVKAKKRVGITVADDEYNGKLKSKVVDTFSPNEWADRHSTSTGSDIVDDDDEEDVKDAVTSSDDEDMDEIDLDDL